MSSFDIQIYQFAGFGVIVIFIVIATLIAVKTRWASGAPMFSGPAKHINTPQEAFEHLQSMRWLRREHLRGIYLNPTGRILWEEDIARGTITSAHISLREIITPAILSRASGIIIAHNHLSGKAEPSMADEEITILLENLVIQLNIDLYDHIIIAGDCYYSFANAKKLRCMDYKKCLNHEIR